MAAMKVRSTNMGSKSSEKEMQQSIHEEIDDDSDEDMSVASENSNSDEENGDDEASGEESPDEDEDEHEAASVEDDGEDNVSDEEEGEDEDVSEDDDDDEMDDHSIDGDLGAGDWMEAEDNEHNSNLSSSEDEARPQGLTQMEDSSDPKLHGNAGWADAMAKILRMSKPKGKKSIVLAKAKKLSQVGALEKPQEEEEDYGFEIDGEVDKEKDVKPNEVDLDVKPDVEDIKPKLRRKDLLSEGRVRPDILSYDRERALAKIATKGVVQLFNAVREQQKDINKKIKLAKGSIRKEDKILKSVDKVSFLNSLMGNAKSVRVEDHVQTKAEEDVKPENPSTWNVLRDNFLTGSDMKDWDKSGEIKLEDDMDEIELK